MARALSARLASSVPGSPTMGLCKSASKNSISPTSSVTADAASLRRSARRLTVAAVLALGLAGCMGAGGPDSTGSIQGSGAYAGSGTAEGWRSYADDWGKRYESKPGDKTASLNYARALRVLDQNQQAVAVLQTAALKAPNDTEILAAYGKALIDVGQLKQAQEVLSRAHSPERPDWRVLSAQGAVSDQLGEHEQAQNLYAAALKIQPNDPGVLSNLGLSYALTRKLPQAEATLRQAVDQAGADPRARQNLALVLALQGKFAEAEGVAQRDMSPVEAAQSIATVRQMVSQSNNWDKIRSLDGKGKATSRPAKSAARAPSPQPAEASNPG